MSGIRIISIPEGFAPYDIRAQWVGVEMPLADHPDGDQPDKYCVSRQAAVTALKIARKYDAARFWDGFHPLGQYLLFNQSECEYIP
jgi:hypothetical protein